MRTTLLRKRDIFLLALQPYEALLDKVKLHCQKKSADKFRCSRVEERQSNEYSKPLDNNTISRSVELRHVLHYLRANRDTQNY